MQYNTERKSHLIPGRADKFVKLMDWESVSDALSGGLAPASINVLGASGDVLHCGNPMDKKSLLAGSAYYLANLNHFDPVLLYFEQMLARDVNAPVYLEVLAVVEPKFHYAITELSLDRFIIQVMGVNEAEVTDSLNTELGFQCRLMQGDVIYLPEGSTVQLESQESSIAVIANCRTYNPEGLDSSTARKTSAAGTQRLCQDEIFEDTMQGIQRLCRCLLNNPVAPKLNLPHEPRTPGAIDPDMMFRRVANQKTRVVTEDSNYLLYARGVSIDLGSTLKSPEAFSQLLTDGLSIRALVQTGSLGEADSRQLIYNLLSRGIIEQYVGH